MFSYAQAAVLGLLQGVTELFPISSLGHSVILPSLLEWNIDQASASFVGFVVLTHLATALVLFAFFWRDWLRIIISVLRSIGARTLRDPYAKLGWLIIVSTIPVGVLGFLFQDPLTHLFASPRLVAGMLILNGLVLYAAEKLRRKASEGEASDAALAQLSFTQAMGIGLAQCFALVPGFSRTGLTMTGSLASGLGHENAARYAFLLATPVIFSAAVLKVPHVFKEGGAVLGPALFGALCAALAAYVSVRFLTTYFKTNTLMPFAVYCVIAGAACVLLLA
ncbi:MAG: undecaprenyl-diphosphate phosphatase [Minisyncoccia bacterium]|jgi:undecaprenyl-diphosphatase